MRHGGGGTARFRCGVSCRGKAAHGNASRGRPGPRPRLRTPAKGQWLMAAARPARPICALANGPVRILELGTCLGSGGDYLLSGGCREGLPLLRVWRAATHCSRNAQKNAVRAVHSDEEGKDVRVAPGPFEQIPCPRSCRGHRAVRRRVPRRLPRRGDASACPVGGASSLRCRRRCIAGRGRRHPLVRWTCMTRACSWHLSGSTGCGRVRCVSGWASWSSAPTSSRVSRRAA